MFKNSSFIKKRQLIKIFLLVVCGALILTATRTKGDLGPPGPPPSEECVGLVEVHGWAWSDNIGWISFSSETDGSSVEYGVKIDYEALGGIPPYCPGLLQGYAWSDNIGWITFNESELAGCPSSPCQAYTSSMKTDPEEPVGGWARACYVFQSGCSGPLNPDAGEWDGWISLNADPNLVINRDTGEFEGWAWSDDFGWISFNCLNEEECTTSNYKIAEWNLPSTNLTPVCDSLIANPSSGDAPLTVNFTGSGHDQDETGTIVQYEFNTGEGACEGSIVCGLALTQAACEACGCSWDKVSGFCTGPSRDCSSLDSEESCSPCGLCSWNFNKITTSENTAQYTYNATGTYCAKLRVQDDYGDWSETPGDCPDTCTQQIIVTEGEGGNNPPTADITCYPEGCSQSPGSCTGYTRSLFCLKNDSTDPDGQGDIASSTWIITGETNDTLHCTVDPLCNWTMPSYFPSGDYNAELHVEDYAGEVDIVNQSFKILQDIIADFECSLKPDSGWQSCDGFKVAEGARVYFKDTSTGSENTSGGYWPITSWSWTFTDGSPSTSNAQNPSATFEALSSNSGLVTLSVVDQNGRSDQVSYKLYITKSFPQWQEASPY